MPKRYKVVKINSNKSNWDEVIKSYEPKVRYILARLEVDDKHYEDMYQESMAGVVEAINKYSGELLSSKVERAILINILKYLFANRTLTGYGLKAYNLDEMKNLINCETEKDIEDINFGHLEASPHAKYAVQSSSYDDNIPYPYIDTISSGERPVEEAVSSTFDYNQNMEWIYKNLDNLQPRTKFAIVNFYGLYDTTPLTQEKIASILGITYQAVQDLISRGLGKLRYQYESEITR